MNQLNTWEMTLCETGALELPRYFPRQLITPTELTLEQDYFRNKLRRHNRLLHGWGVVCGAQVCLVRKSDGTAEAWKVEIQSGYILGPYGDEILIDCDRVVDLRTNSVSAATGDHPGELSDPWCSEVFVERRGGPLYIAVRYKQMQTRPVRVQPAGCGCDDSQCENSRLRDGYEIGLLPRCPPLGDASVTFDDLLKGTLSDCPDCPADGWVGLARVDFDAKGSITAIDNCVCRRMVVSFSRMWWQCKTGTVTITKVQPDFLTQGDQKATIQMTGSGLQQDTRVDFGSGVEVLDSKFDQSKEVLTVVVNVSDTAQVGPRRIAATNADCSTGGADWEIRPQARPTPAPAPAPRPTPSPAPVPPRDNVPPTTPTPRPRRRNT